jgi:membrane fusion protein, heavy metal efflux system
VFSFSNRKFQAGAQCLCRGLAGRGLFLAAALMAGLAGAGCSRTPSAPGEAAKTASGEVIAKDAKGIQTVQVKLTDVPEYLELPAHIEADPTKVVHVFTAAGGRIVEMKVRPWDRVEKGQTLAILESSDLSRAVADYQKAKADNEVKQKALARADDLLAHNAIAQKDYQQAQADAQMAEAEVKTARERIRVLGADPDTASTELHVVAPRSGVVLDIGAAQGELSKSLDAPLPMCTIADISTVWALGEIYEKDLAVAKAGEATLVSLNAYPQEHWQGQVSVVSQAVDPTTRTLRVRVVLPNPKGELKPSMFGTIRVLRSTSKGILIPATAVIREGPETTVFVRLNDSRYQRRSVVTGRTTEQQIEIVSGLKPEETVITDGALLLRAAAQE